MSLWHRPVKSHILSRARPRWKNTQSIFPKIYHISSLSFSFFFSPLFFHPPGMNVSAKHSDFAGVFQPLQVKAQWSSVTSMKWSPMDLVLAGETSNVNNTSRERISKPSEAWEGFPQMVPMDMAVPGFLKWFFARKSLSSSRVLIRLYTWVCTQADKVQSFFYRIDPNSRDPLKIFRCWSMRGWHRLTGKTGREAGEVNGSNDCKFTTLNEEKF